MKIGELKKIIKETVKEAIQEELRGVLLEIIKSQNNQPQIIERLVTTEGITPTYNTKITSQVPSNIEEIRSNMRGKYASILEQTTPFNAIEETQKFVPRGNGELGVGDLGEDQIMSLLASK
jgi:HD superfamily phosphohydrolase